MKKWGVYYGNLLVSDYRKGKKAVYTSLARANMYAHEMNAFQSGYFVAEYKGKNNGKHNSRKEKANNASI